MDINETYGMYVDNSACLFQLNRKFEPFDKLSTHWLVILWLIAWFANL